MSRLIDSDEVYKVLTDNYHHKTEIQHEALKEALSKVATVDIDAITESHEMNGDEWKEFVNVIRCKDCIERSGCIIRSIQDFGDDFYCKWGSKQEI